MKNLLKCLLVASLVFLALAPSPVLAQEPTPVPGDHITGDKVVIGNSFTLGPGEVLDGGMLVIGGTASSAEGSSINGDLVLVGGTLSLNGTVNGDVVSIGGGVNLGNTAVINGDVSLLGGTLQRTGQSVVNGEITEEIPENFNFPGDANRWFPLQSERSPLSKALGALFQTLAMGILAVLVGLLLPHNIKNIAAKITGEPLVSGGIGLLAIIVAPIVFVLLLITILLIPVSILGFIALSLAILLGFVTVGYEIGQRLASLFKTTWHPSIAAGLGTLLLTLVTSIANFIPCVGWVLGFLASIIGLGAVITSRVGSEKYANQLIQAVIPVAAGTPAPVVSEPFEDHSGAEPPVPPEI